MGWNESPTLFWLRRLRSAPLRPLQRPPPSLRRRQPAPGAAPAPAPNAAPGAPAQLARRCPQQRCKRAGSTPPKSSKQKFGQNRRHFCLSAREAAFLDSWSATIGRLRPYSVKRTVSRPICEVKPLQATSVLRWGTTWESVVPQAPLFFFGSVSVVFPFLGLTTFFRRRGICIANDHACSD